MSFRRQDRFYPVDMHIRIFREAHSLPVTPVSGCLNFQRVIKAEQPIGFDKNGLPTDYITILTDGGGKIITAFPGFCMQDKTMPNDQVVYQQGCL